MRGNERGIDMYPGPEYPPEWDDPESPEFDSNDPSTWEFAENFDKWVLAVENYETCNGYEKWLDSEYNPIA